jgi:hypothetical protein
MKLSVQTKSEILLLIMLLSGISMCLGMAIAHLAVLTISEVILVMALCSYGRIVTQENKRINSKF